MHNKSLNLNKVYRYLNVVFETFIKLLKGPFRMPIHLFVDHFNALNPEEGRD